jgi:hypothetical protein
MKRAKSARGLVLESLEQRVMLAADLAPFTINGWPAEIYVSKVEGVKENSANILDTDSLFIGGGLKNVGNAAVAKNFTSKLFIDNVLESTDVYSVAQFGNLGVNFVFGISDVGIGKLKPGVHTLKYVVDTTNAVAEDNEGNNTLEYQFTVGASDVTKVAFVKGPKPAVAGVTMAPITVKATNALKNNVPGDTVELSVVSGPGAILGTTSVVTDANGVATFNDISFTVAGTYVLKATDGAIDSLNSAPFKVSAAVLATLEFVQEPQDVNAATKFGLPVTVRAEDAFGNLLKGQAIKLAINTGPGGAKMLGGPTAVTNASGIATFAANTFRTAGDYTLTASKLLISDTSAQFTVNPGVVNKLVFTTLPVGAVHGVNTTVVVTGVDLYGNTATSLNAGLITLFLLAKPVGGQLTGTTEKTPTAGVATYNDLQFSVAGKYSLKAQMGSKTFNSLTFVVA